MLIFFFNSLILSNIEIFENYNKYINCSNIETKIIFCLFLSLNSLSGGAVYISNNNFSINIYHCIFNNCTSYNGGGAIFFNGLIGSSINISKCCGYWCYNTYNVNYPNGQFCFFQNSIFFFDLNSISFCSPTPSGRMSPVTLSYSIYSNLSFCNFSHNKVYQRASLIVYYSTNILMKFSSIVSNYASHSISYQVQSSIMKTEFTNIISNTRGLSTGIIVLCSPHLSTSATLTCFKCIIMNNEGSNYFGASTESKIILSYCWIDKIISSTSITYQNNQGITNYYQYSFFQSFPCLTIVTFNNFSQKYQKKQNNFLFLLLIYN